MIQFNIPANLGGEIAYIKATMQNQKYCGDGEFTKKCHALLESLTGTKKALLTTSCTHALEMTAILCDIQAGDEVIMPSYTFVSTANAFVLRGAKIVFVDIRPDTMNIDETKIEQAITSKTKAIVPVHYAGVGCDMAKIMDIAKSHNLFVVEDAAQAIGATYNNRPLGTIGDFGTFSFHETKNISCGEGGALLVNNPQFSERAEIIREKGTNRSRFLRGQVDKYTWCDMGSSYLPSELNAAYLLAQLENMQEINQNRLEAWNYYRDKLSPLKPKLEIAEIPANCEHPAHMFWIKPKDLDERTKLIQFLKEREILAVFHYVPLHSSPAGRKFSKFSGEDLHTTKESERLLRLPMYYGIAKADLDRVTGAICEFFR
ncbi:MAG: dTDP-4-amino-4,6-dideoxygalactose transaminase [Defluviitaleaceae bacterium]|nr:dTDP-4-amino-4,6-dideoxygalactose transaminase [Defluviitaleaceae bacterium]